MIGEARHRAILEAKVLTADGGGGFSEAWQSYATVWAQLEPQGGSEGLAAGRTESRVSHRILIRRRTDVSANHRIRIGARQFAILAVVDEGPHAFWLVLFCEENAPS